MATSPAVHRSSGPSGAHLPGGTRLLLFFILIALLAVCIAVSWTTRGAMTFLNGKGGPRGAGAQSLVDLQPWQTAQTLAPLAISAEENEFAREAERLADHEVDQAFAAALRQTRLEAQHRKLTGEALSLSQKVAQLEQLRQQDQALVDGLTAKATSLKGSTKNGAQAASVSDDLEVAKAQLGLDSDELTDAQGDLQRASGDNSVQIQDELAAHEASMRKYDSEAANGGEIAVLSTAQNHTLASRINAWFSQLQRESLLKQAIEDAQNDSRQLTTEHNTLEARANAAAAAGAATDHATQLSNLRDRSIERQILSIDDDRIQTEQQLATVYGKWLAQVKLQHEIVLHLILRSLILILVILSG